MRHILVLLFSAWMLLPAWAEDIHAGKYERQLKGYPLQAVIDQWGQPYVGDKTLFSGNQNYYWRSCYDTGRVLTQCHYGSCVSQRETFCCRQTVSVDKNNIIQSYNHSDNAQGRARCYSSLNFTDIQKYAKNPENVYGYYVVSDEYITVMLELDKQVAEEKKRNQICNTSHCLKTFEFKNTCAAVAEPSVGFTGMPYRNVEIFFVKHDDPEQAKREAVAKCTKKYGAQAGCQPSQTPRPFNGYLCATPNGYRQKSW